MEGPVEPSPEAVLGFLAERGGRVRHADLVEHFRGALGGEPEQRARARARFKDLVNAVATVRTDPADGTKYVHLKKRFCAGAPQPADPPGPAPEPARDRTRPPPEDGPATPRAARPGLRDALSGGSPRPGRSSPGGAGGGARGRGGSDSASAAEEEGGGAPVALDPLEHAWMLSAADGHWAGLEALLACEPGLLAKRDFITGFTCLHWAAKHGRQELLATLVNFAGKHRLPVNINARTSGGYTALHLAAMHGHVEVVKLLVGAYDADVDIRDYSGRKASQYLSVSVAEEIKSLVGALDEEEEVDSTTGSGGGRWRLSKVLPAHLITYKLSHVLEDGDHHHLTEGWAGGKAKDRKASGSSSGRIKPRLNKIRFKTQVIHSTLSSRDPEQPLEEEEEERSFRGHSSSFKLRPKSNVFG
ncbi:PREDICTED: ankyrin repeat domain-containing protein SOWAHC [Chinchilla lanigera]|uniref:ankyrin repeat domain-containing protein SOWAHC n=1 Tax=Chinchilla lanigera TaxID=34839 RepID=UPI0006974A24|nr:PREDICTED: ankyrin repeat domain-containing protein SOWAHC [Chinchilla lanigera]